MTNRQLIEADLARLFPVRTEFDRQMQELSKAVAKFEHAATQCCEAINEFKAKL